MHCALLSLYMFFYEANKDDSDIVHKKYKSYNNNYNKNTGNDKWLLTIKAQLLSNGSLHTVQSSKVRMIIQDLVHTLWRLATTKYILKMLSVYIL